MNVVLADDHAMFRENLGSYLESQGHSVVGEASDGLEAVRMVREHRPDIAVLDIGMPHLNGIEAARQICKRAPGSAPIMLTMFEEHAYVVDSLKAGARGYVLKSQAAADLMTAIQEVARGSVYLSPGISQTLVEEYLSEQRAAQDPLSERERQVLQLIAEGRRGREIAAILSVSTKTVESHRARIMGKLDLHGTADLVRYAIRRGVIRA